MEDAVTRKLPADLKRENQIYWAAYRTSASAQFFSSP